MRLSVRVCASTLTVHGASHWRQSLKLCFVSTVCTPHCTQSGHGEWRGHGFCPSFFLLTWTYWALLDLEVGMSGGWSCRQPHTAGRAGEARVARCEQEQLLQRPLERPKALPKIDILKEECTLLLLCAPSNCRGGQRGGPLAAGWKQRGAASLSMGSQIL